MSVYTPEDTRHGEYTLVQLQEMLTWRWYADGPRLVAIGPQVDRNGSPCHRFRGFDLPYGVPPYQSLNCTFDVWVNLDTALSWFRQFPPRPWKRDQVRSDTQGIKDCPIAEAVTVILDQVEAG